jgi:tetratricopeptide (TPR) repeat protein
MVQSANAMVARKQIPPELRTEFFALYAEGRQNSVLHAMRGGISALRLGYHDLAKEALEQAVHEIEALQYGTAQAERTKSKFVGEKEKWFKGEPYERSALYFYRGLIYLQDQDFGNAAACFKRAQVMDITADDAPGFAGDWMIAEAALALASYGQNDPATADQAISRLKKYFQYREGMSLPTPETNTLLIFETGHGPVKWGDGQFGEKLRFKEVPPSMEKILIKEASQEIPALQESLYYQASTRGGRQIDAILSDKASFKEDTQNATLGLAGGAVVASQTEKSGIAAGVLGLAAIGTGIFSAVTQPEADLRSWENLPHSIHLYFLKVPPEGLDIEWQGVGSGGSSVKKESLRITPEKENKINVVWVKRIAGD